METLPQSTVSKMPFRKRLQWSEQPMADAVKTVEDGLPTSPVARKHNVLRTTLQYRMSGNAVHCVKQGSKPYLTSDKGIINVEIYPFNPDDELRPSVDNEAEGDSKRGTRYYIKFKLLYVNFLRF